MIWAQLNRWDRFRLLTLFLTLTVTMLFVGSCEWDPVRDNPLDPRSKGYRPLPEEGSVDVRVMTLFSNNRPIQNAKVELLTEPVLSKQTDEDGWARFSEVAAGTLLVQATTDDNSKPNYAPASRQIVIRKATNIETNLYLDALPNFIYADAYAVTRQVIGDETIFYQVHLKAYVEDPDGGGDVKRVEWTWNDTTTLEGVLHYSRLDSLFHDTLISGKSFGNIDAALDGVFQFEAFDGLERVIHDVPTLESLPYNQIVANPTIAWNFTWGDDFVSPNQFNYLLRIHQISQFYPLVYDSLITPSGIRDNEHRVENPLESGNYDYSVWVVDLHGNRARSKPAAFRIDLE